MCLQVWFATGQWFIYFNRNKAIYKVFTVLFQNKGTLCSDRGCYPTFSVRLNNFIWQHVNRCIYVQTSTEVQRTHDVKSRKQNVIERCCCGHRSIVWLIYIRVLGNFISFVYLRKERNVRKNFVNRMVLLNCIDYGRNCSPCLIGVNNPVSCRINQIFPMWKPSTHSCVVLSMDCW